MTIKSWIKGIGCIALCLFFFSANIFAAESAANRDSKLLWLSVDPVGIHVPTIVAPTYRVGVFLGKDFVFGGGSGTNSVTQNDGNTTSTASFSNQGVWARYFLGNSFNLLMAYDKREWKADATVSQVVTSGLSSVTAKAKVNLTATANVGTLGISNHWTFDSGFTLGVDWLLLSGVVNSSTTNSVVTNTGVDTAQLNKDLDSFGKFLNQVSGVGGLTVLTLGWAF